MKNKSTLIFDGNYWLSKTYFVSRAIKHNGKFDFNDNLEKDRNLLLWKLSVDFSAEIRRFADVIDQIVYVVDYGSWRKKIKDLDKEYKGHRVKDESINWTEIFNTHDEFIKALEKTGNIIISKMYETEGDDWVFMWSKHLNQNGQNAIIISGDNDLLQLVDKDENTSAFTLYYNKFNKVLYTFNKFNDWLVEEDEIEYDIFNIPSTLISNLKTNLKILIDKEKIKTEDVHVNKFILNKILIGDKGDNISSIHRIVKINKNGKSREYNFTQRKSDIVIQKYIDKYLLLSDDMFFDSESINFIATEAKKLIKDNDYKISDIISKFKENRDLMYLHSSCIPENIVNGMLDSINNNDNSTKKSNINALTNKDLILENTTWKPEQIKIEDKIEKIKIDNTKKTSSFNDDFWNKFDI